MADHYFRSVPGRLVYRFGTDTPIGASRVSPPPTAAEQEAGKEPIVWDTTKVTRIPDREYRENIRDYSEAVRAGDLKAATEAEYLAAQEPTAPPATTHEEAV